MTKVKHQIITERKLYEMVNRISDKLVEKYLASKHWKKTINEMARKNAEKLIKG